MGTAYTYGYVVGTDQRESIPLRGWCETARRHGYILGMRFYRTAPRLNPRVVAAVVILAASGCGVDSIPGGGGFGGPPLLPDTRPPSVVILSGRIVSSSPTSETVDLTLRNDGGPGFYYVEFFSVAADVSVPVSSEYTNGPSVEVKAGYAETARWEVAHSSQNLVLRSARVFSRAPNSGTFTLTGCWGC
jgi:hypothetical protein